MKKQLLKHALSWALMLAMMLAMLPAVALPVKAAAVVTPSPLTPNDPNFVFTQGGTQLDPSVSLPADGLYTFEKTVPITQDHDYIFSGWVYSDPFTSDGNDYNPHFLATADGGNSYVVDKWEPAVSGSWVYVSQEFVASSTSPLDLNIRYKDTVTQIFYGVSFKDVTTGAELLPNGMADFTTKDSGYTETQLSAADINAKFGRVDPNADKCGGLKVVSQTAATPWIWCDIPVTPNTDYVMSTWAIGDGKVLFGFDNLSTNYAQDLNPNLVQQVSFTFNSGSNSDIKLNILADVTPDGSKTFYLYPLSLKEAGSNVELLSQGIANYTQPATSLWGNDGWIGWFGNTPFDGDITNNNHDVYFTPLTAAEFNTAIGYNGGVPPTSKIVMGGTRIEKGSGGDIWMNNVPVVPGHEYTFSGWVYTDPFAAGVDVNPHFLAYDVGNLTAKSNGLVVDHWENITDSGWKYVYVNGYPPIGVNNGVNDEHCSRFIAYNDKVDLEIRYKGSAVQYFYNVALVDVTTGENVIPNGLMDFTPQSSQFKHLTAQEMNDVFFPSSTPKHVPVDDITGIPASVNAGKLKLNGVVAPSNATNKTIIWSVKADTGAGASLSGDTLTTDSAGTVTVTATVVDGAATGINFTKDFIIDIQPPMVLGDNPNISITHNGWVNYGGAQYMPIYMEPGDVLNPAGETFDVIPGHKYRAGVWVIGGGRPILFMRQFPNFYGSPEQGFDVDPDVWTFISLEFTVSDPFLGWKIDNGYGGDQAATTYFYGPSLVDITDPNNEIELFTDVQQSVTGWKRWSSAGYSAAPGEASPYASDGSPATGMYYDISAAELQKLFPTPRGGHVAVDSISGVDTNLQVGTSTLYATVNPVKASKKTILWSVKDAGSTGATVIGNTLTTTAPGTLTLTATIVKGGALADPTDNTSAVNYTQDFTFMITTNDPYLKDSNVPSIYHIPYLQQPGGIGSIYGANFKKSTGAGVVVVIQPLSGFTGTPDPANAPYQLTPANVQDNIIQYEIPANVPYDVWAVWVKNDAGNWSDVQFVNRADIMWINQHTVYSGQKLIIGGRNMVNPTDRSANNVGVRFVPLGGGEVLYGKVFDLTDYTVHFTAPAGLVPGVKYKVQYTNGAGGNSGWVDMIDTNREVVTAVATNANITWFDNKFDANVAWTASINTANIINVKDLVGASWDPTGLNDVGSLVTTALADLSAAGGGVLYFPEGVYGIDRIKVPDNTAIVGDGQDKSILHWNGTAQKGGDPLVISNGLAVGIFGLSLYNDHMYSEFGLTSSSIGAMIILTNATAAYSGIGGYMIKDVKAINTDGAGVSLGGPRPCAVEDCYIKAYGGAIAFSGNAQVPTVRNTYSFNRCGGNINNSGSDCLYVDNSTIDGYSRKWEAEQMRLAKFLASGETLDQYVLTDGNPDPDFPFLGMDNGDSEHRYMDVSGDDMLFINNELKGLFGGDVDNCGEGICMQGMPPSIIGSPVSATPKTLVTGKDLTPLVNAGSSTIMITAGPGIGQVRKVLYYDQNANGTLVLDEPWDVIPTTASVYVVKPSMTALNIFANNKFLGNISKGDIYYYYSYDMVIANNEFTGGGAGPWLTSWGGYSNHYYTTLYNNKFAGQCNHYMSEGNKGIMFGGQDGVVSIGGGNTTQVFGAQIVHNEMLGLTQNPVATGDLRVWWLSNYTWGILMGAYNARQNIMTYAYANGINIGKNLSSSNPNTWGTVVDGNKINNTVNGLNTGNQAFDTVIRNNDFYNNKNGEITNEADATRNIMLNTTGLAAPGYQQLAAIDKSVLNPVDKSALSTAITAAEANLDSVAVSADGKDIKEENQWVTAAVYEAYEAAITNTQAVLDDGTVTQKQVDDALAALNEATVAFNAAKQNGMLKTVIVGGVEILYKVENGVATLDLTNTSQEQMAKIFNTTGSEDKIVFDLREQSAVDLLVPAGYFKSLDKTLIIRTSTGDYSIKTKTIWNNSGKNRLITVHKNGITLKNI